MSIHLDSLRLKGRPKEWGFERFENYSEHVLKNHYWREVECLFRIEKYNDKLSEGQFKIKAPRLFGVGHIEVLKTWCLQECYGEFILEEFIEKHNDSWEILFRCSDALKEDGLKELEALSGLGICHKDLVYQIVRTHE